jgi:hypothetical protein
LVKSVAKKNGKRSLVAAQDLPPPLPADSPEGEAAGVVIGRFVDRTGNRVLVIEGDDALFVFFPVADLRKNLREMGFYYTE